MKQTRTSVLHAKALSNAIKLLNAIGAQYAIKDAEGNLHGDVKAVAKQKKAPSKYPYGSLSTHIRPYIDSCGVNQTVTIPIGQYDLDSVYGSASSMATKMWGNGCHKVGTSADKKSVLLTRTEKLDDLDDLFSQLGISNGNLR
jgi:hypothetical protein